MLEHIVFIKFKEGTPAEAIDEIVAMARALKEKIPGIIDMTAGKNITNRSQGFQFALVARMENRETLDVYAPHEAHQAMVAKISVYKEDLIAIDYEIE
mmetsp:Transcript_8518/g.35543  ORF Transcript_8518/g.35543 Transcript_8518/m.35543 type:complete len:98 (-) Transcript_8518:208-501(-)|eukprot:CAMPEP_0114625734 /NCGR_PEP_ID=MMETSP0168-20121206/11419_1 /TAXON_ID=95228 ORGANISM="Vannella sp., Strain DIVA3 517/6/12" /NCGR_SAMPLE_ID=MMETSP0168 /ASSEMBLY_ACC=CAM_ASM_000044 /LENGTH=97 /DNA_ID=CAMNT_0001837017 /DNA_START=46 /DNA_END=339 /DNA_ORIENTATION=-